MPTYPAPSPVQVVVDVPFGVLHVVATERHDVVVTVLPSDPARSGSVRAAEEVRVDHDGDTVRITYPGSWKQWVMPFGAGTADITIELPINSHLQGKAGSLWAEGPLGTVELALSAGDARLDDVDRLDLRSSAGNVVVGGANGRATIRSNAGSVRVAEVAGEASIHASNGAVNVAGVTGTLDVRGSHGDIALGRVRGTVTVRSSYAGIRVDEASSGTVTLRTSYGAIEVGVPEGTAAYLDVSSEHGAVRNQLTPTEGPVEDEATVEVHASTGYGDVVVRRP